MAEIINDEGGNPIYHIKAYQGTSIKRGIEYIDANGSAIDLTPLTLTMKIRSIQHPTTSTAYNVSSAFGVLTEGDGINVIDAVNGILEIHVSPFITKDMPAGKYYYDLEATSSDTYKIITGTIEMKEVNLGSYNYAILDQADWYVDVRRFDSSLRYLDDLSGNGNHLYFASDAGGASTNDPFYLSWNGEDSVWFPGTTPTANFISTPESANNSITGDIDIRWHGALINWSAQTAFIGKWNTVGQRSYLFKLDASGFLQFLMSNNGTTEYTATSTVAISGVLGQEFYLRVTREVASGRVIFYTSSDGVKWDQFGESVILQAGVSIFDGNDVVYIGRQINSHPIFGKVMDAQIYDGNSELKLSFDVNDIEDDLVTFTSSRTGEVWTISRATGAHKISVVNRPLLAFAVDDYMQATDNALLDFGASDPFTVIFCFRRFPDQPVSPVETYITKKGDQLTDVGWQVACGVGAHASFRISDGVGSPNAFAPSSNANGAFTAITARRSIASDNIKLSTNNSHGTPVTDNTTGSLSNFAHLRVGRRSAGASDYGYFEFLGAAIFRSELTDDEVKYAIGAFQ